MEPLQVLAAHWRISSTLLKNLHWWQRHAQCCTRANSHFDVNIVSFGLLMFVEHVWSKCFARLLLLEMSGRQICSPAAREIGCKGACNCSLSKTSALARAFMHKQGTPARGEPCNVIWHHFRKHSRKYSRHLIFIVCTACNYAAMPLTIQITCA